MKDLLNKEIENIFLWIPVMIAVGIISFFQLDFDLSLVPCLIALGISSLTFFMLRKKYYLRIIALGIFFIVLGFSAAVVRTDSLKSPVIKDKTDQIWIEANVSEILHNEKGKRIVLDNIYSDYISQNEMPKKIRISVKTKMDEVEIGDRILVKCILMPPPEPSMPKGFDFAEFAYFKQIGAIGYATSHIRILEKAVDVSTIANYISTIRKRAGEKIAAVMDQPAAAIGTGLLVGDSSSIPKDDFDIIRTSGIAHIIAISGMHIVVVVGMIFLTFRFFLSRSQYIVLHYNIKKISAVLAIIGSFLYLLLAGSPVSAQRAFIMSTLVLLAIILDRNASPMRSIAISAIILLLITPEAIMSASLQMSYAACIALIASFEISKRIFATEGRHKFSGLKKVSLYFASVTFASLVAGLATAPFIIYHFNQFSTYSLLTNILSVPLSDFYIMPLGMIALLLMPLGLEKIALVPMEWGIDLMFNYAKYISSLPNASFYIPSFTDAGIALIACGGLVACFSNTKLRFAGVIPILFGLTTLYEYKKPHILLDRDGKIFAIQNEQNQLIVSSKSKAKFTRDVWLQSSGENEVVTLKDMGSDTCTNEVCLYEKNGKTAIIVGKESDPSAYCYTADLFINMSEKEFVCDKSTTNITLSDLKNKGAHMIWLEENITVDTVLAYRPNRIWNNRG
jgi:competence protein ComEC